MGKEVLEPSAWFTWQRLVFPEIAQSDKVFPRVLQLSKCHRGIIKAEPILRQCGQVTCLAVRFALYFLPGLSLYDARLVPEP
jgi:hypothetical protein